MKAAPWVRFVSCLLACWGACGCSPDAATRAGAQHPPEEPAGQRATLSTGIEARWIELGDPNGEPVLFLHGYTDTSRSFAPLMHALARLRPNLRLLALDQRGHGGSSLPTGPDCAREPERCFALELLADDALAFLDRMRIERAHVVGHSMGSLVAEHLALARPARVRRLVLIGTAGRGAGNPVLEGFLRAGLVEGPWKQSLEAQGLAFPSDAWARLPGDADAQSQAWLAANWVAELGAEPAFLARVLPETAATPLGTWIGALRAQLAHDLLDELGELRVPTLVLAPVQDIFFPEEPDQRLLREALAGATSRHGTIWFWKRYGRATPSPGMPQNDLGHNLHWSATAPVARDLAAFLRESGAPTDELAFLEGDPPRLRALPGAATILKGTSD